METVSMRGPGGDRVNNQNVNGSSILIVLLRAHANVNALTKVASYCLFSFYSWFIQM